VTYAEFRAVLLEDQRANVLNSKGRLIVTAYRAAAYAHSNRNKGLLWSVVARCICGLYKILIDYVMGVYIPVEAKIGPGLCIYHGVGIVLHPACVLGRNCILRQGVTIGSKDGTGETVPIIGNHVDVGAQAIIIGRITIGDNATVGAGTVVLESVPAGALIVGNPGRVRLIAGG